VYNENYYITVQKMNIQHVSDGTYVNIMLN